jgi:uncharacterized protein YdeI (YjbR/CyaY-like superfamily)
MKSLNVTGRDDWRAWLQDNHSVETEIWLVINKKHAARPGILYKDAVEEALCYGWIDGLARSLDHETYTQRFTPRRPNSNWAESNKLRVRKLIAAGRMTPAGLAAIPPSILEEDPNP